MGNLLPRRIALVLPQVAGCDPVGADTGRGVAPPGYDPGMPDTVLPANFTLVLAPHPDAPYALQVLGEQYWEHKGIAADTGDVVWARAVSDLDYASWSGTPYYAAAAGVVATAPEFDCADCGEPLTLSSRQTLTDARRDNEVRCRACNGTLEERAAGVLDPSARARRERNAERDASARAAEELRRVSAADLDAARRLAIETRYPGGTEDDGGYTLHQASVATRVAALAVIHAAGQPSGLIHPVRYRDGSIAPNPETARELFVDAWHSDLLVVHPSSPANAFVWDEEEPATLGNGLFADRAYFAAPGEGQLARRLESFAEDLRRELSLGRLWSTERAEARDLSGRLMAEEAIRYLSYELAVHDLPDPAAQHQERLRTHAAKAAGAFALGHVYRMAWMAARDAISAYKRIQGMSREKAATHGLNKFVSYIQRGLDEPETLGEAFDERSDLPLSAATDVVFRAVFGLNPMTATPADVTERAAGSADRELRKACDARIPDRSAVMEWLRTSGAWEPAEFRKALSRAVDEEDELCGPRCAHHSAPMVAYEAGRVYDRIASRVGEFDAAIVTAESLSIGNESPYEGRSGDLVLATLARELGWEPEGADEDA